MSKKLFLYERTKLEDLIEIFSEKLINSNNDPFQKDIVIVQSQGMSRWITRKCAQINGVFTNVEFMFPNAFLEKFFSRVFEDKYIPELISGNVNTFRIMNELIEERNNNPHGIFKEIFDYVGDFETRLYKISTVLSEIFENYQLFRPELIYSWKQGDIDKFKNQYSQKKDEFDRQCELYRRIMPRELFDKSDIFNEICNNFSSLTIPSDFPERLYIFGVSILPPYFLKVFEQLSEFCEVNLFLMNPCTEYWIDIVNRKESAKKFLQAAKDTGIENLSENELHFYTGNSLLAEFGSMGREFFSQILEFTEEISDNSQNIDISRDTLLHCIQNDISTLAEGRENDFEFCDNDRSVLINSCHGKRRELEVLKDYILNVLDNNKDIHPSDIIVMAPDIQPYSQLIDSIFSELFSEHRISYSISDVALSEEDPVVAVFLDILERLSGKFTVSDMLSMLERPLIMQSFEFSENAIDIIRYWVSELNIKYGFEENSLNSWNHGIKRLITGYLTHEEEVLWDEVTSYPYIEGDYAVTAGNLAEFTDFIQSLAEQCRTKKSIQEWGMFFYDIIRKLQKNSEDISGFNILVNAVDMLCGQDNIQILSGFDKKIDFDIIRTYLKRQFRNSLSSKGFLSDGITFSSMLPMRSIPFKAICLLGMNIDSFPGKEKMLEFDLIKERPKVGDRSKRKSDMYLFLETIMSAKDRLYISFCGQDEKDNSRKEPSVLVSFLMEYISDNYERTTNNILNNIFVEHRLHGFHSDYFDNKNLLFSYSDKNYNICLKRNSVNDESFKYEPVDMLQKKDFNLSDILSFYKEPTEYFVKKVLNIYDYNTIDVKDEFEKYKIDNLERYNIRTKIYFWLERQKSENDIYNILKFSGSLPINAFGIIDFKKEYNTVKKLYDISYSDKREKFLLNFHTESGFSFEGTYNIIENENRYITFSSFTGKYLIQAFISHILASKLTEKPERTILFSINDHNIRTTCFQYNDITQTALDYTIDLFLHGLNYPVPLFIDAFLAYYEKFKKNESEQKCIAASLTKLKSSKYSFSIVDDFSYRFLYKDNNPLNDEKSSRYWDCYKKLSEFLLSMEVKHEKI